MGPGGLRHRSHCFGGSVSVKGGEGEQSSHAGRAGAVSTLSTAGMGSGGGSEPPMGGVWEPSLLWFLQCPPTPPPQRFSVPIAVSFCIITTKRKKKTKKKPKTQKTKTKRESGGGDGHTSGAAGGVGAPVRVGRGHLGCVVPVGVVSAVTPDAVPDVPPDVPDVAPSPCALRRSRSSRRTPTGSGSGPALGATWGNHTLSITSTCSRVPR